MATINMEITYDMAKRTKTLKERGLDFRDTSLIFTGEVYAFEDIKKEYDELPELTDDMFDRAIYKVDGVKKPSPRRRGPQKKPTKVALHIRLPREVIDYFKSEGSGWQTKISHVLKNWIRSHSHR